MDLLYSPKFVDIPLLIPLWCDNHAAFHIAVNPVLHKRIKHLDIVVKWFIKNKNRFVHPQHISTKLQLVDLLNKSVSVPTFGNLLSKLGLIVLHQTPTSGDVQMFISFYLTLSFMLFYFLPLVLYFGFLFSLWLTYFLYLVGITLSSFLFVFLTLNHYSLSCFLFFSEELGFSWTYSSMIGASSFWLLMILSSTILSYKNNSN